MAKANLKQKDAVVAVNKVLSAKAIELLDAYGHNRKDGKEIILKLANQLYMDNVQRFHFIRADKDTPEAKQFNPILEAEMNERLARIFRGEEGVEWVKMPKELVAKLGSDETAKRILGFQAEIKEERRLIGAALQKVYDGLSDDAKKKKQRNNAMLASELFDERLNELAIELSKLSRSRQDVNVLDYAVIIRDARKAGRALKAPPVKQ